MDISERRFEEEIEYALLKNGYIKGNPKEYNRELAMDTAEVLKFIRETQPNEWELLSKRHGSMVEDNFLRRLDNELKRRGMLDVLRHGIDDTGVSFKLSYFKPGSTMNKTAMDLYDKNRLMITRQVHYSLDNENSLDTVLFLNGLPIITIELKNPLTGQTFEDAIKQYKNDRNPREKIFAFKQRALVHFAVDTDEIYMATELKKQDTFFLPFNRGYENGAGNPPILGDYKTSYLWNQILQKESILDIIQRFIQIKKSDNSKKEMLIFPRFHQLKVVRKLVKDVYENGSGKNYLIQHSAGSGKSNSIAWLAHHLSNLHDMDNKPIFNSIIVITDRRVLDKQLQRDIYNMEHKQGVVTRVDKNAKQLTKALENGDKIIICTLQKFPFVDVSRVSTFNKKFAIIVDEAHSSQTGKSSEKLRETLADIYNQGHDYIEERLQRVAEEEEKYEVENEDEEINETIAKEMKAHGIQPNLSFFAFTATPKQKTLEIFGTKDENGKPVPFDVYSMKQAIEEGFIFDVLQNYTTYKTYFQLGKKVMDDPEYEKSKANKALGRYMSLHPHNLRQKTEIIIEHFRNNVRHLIGGKAKAMLVTGSRLHAVRYFFEFQKYITEKHYDDLGILVAFSGTVKDSITGEIKEYTEESLNKFPENELPEKFETQEYQILLVAEKYQTGFDQPLLHTMYVDKKLSGVKAVQTLSRINRMCRGKTDTFVLDFVNEKEEIQKAFQDYYISTSVSETTDPNVIYDIKNFLDSFMIYDDSQINNLAKVFFKLKKTDKKMDLGKLNSFIDPSVEKFKRLDKQERLDIKNALNKYVRLYSFLTHIISLEDERLHKFYAFAKCLLRKLPKEKGEKFPNINNDVELQYYRTQKQYEGKISLEDEEGILNNSTKGTGLPVEDEKEKISIILKNLNEKWATDFTEIDKVLEQIVEDMAKDEELVIRAKNPLDLFKIVYDERIMGIVLSRMAQNQEFCEKYLEDEDFRKDVDKVLLPLVHNKLSEK
ncbi:MULTISPECIES: type I restriction endonuclease subunit R [Anaerococcus]|jgi:type I site-specific deoxyribonuclease, hsdR family|uniref:type I restriction endonuclease subunit R n=1 Tax=Anaerococcus TaxID=165779 RepID=UPI002904FFDF|nr:type I restriction endonuclease [Anaerococcus sp.]MDU2598238.1 type I restriction endonuclease [Anaerococcus sp.]